MQVSADPLRVAIQHLKDEPYDSSDPLLKATTMEVISTLKELLHMHPLYNEQMRNFIQVGLLGTCTWMLPWRKRSCACMQRCCTLPFAW